MRPGEVTYGSAWALVTGAGSGIGRCYALHLAALGYRIVLVGTRPAPLDLVRDELLAAGCAEVQTVAIDLARADAAQELFDTVCARGIAIDVLINNAGMFSFCDLANTPVERIDRMILLHATTTTHLCRLFAAQMIRRGKSEQEHGSGRKHPGEQERGGSNSRAARGYILNMSSYSQWMPFPGMALYSASKAYMRQFSVCLAKELRSEGIRLTVVCPAGVATDLYGLIPRWQRIGRRLGVLITADYCARRGLKALWRGRRCIVPDWWNRAWIPLCKLAPMCVLGPLRRYTMKFQK